MFRAHEFCLDLEPDPIWTIDPPTPFTADGMTMTFDQAPGVTTHVEITAEDIDGNQFTRQAVLLVSTSLYIDYNGDGCNNLQDVWELALFWNEPFNNDPDGNGLLDIRDLIYIPIDTTSCN